MDLCAKQFVFFTDESIGGQSANGWIKNWYVCIYDID